MQWRHESGKTILKQVAEKIRASTNLFRVPWDKRLSRIIFDSFGVPGTRQAPKKNLMSPCMTVQWLKLSLKRGEKTEGCGLSFVFLKGLFLLLKSPACSRSSAYFLNLRPGEAEGSSQVH